MLATKESEREREREEKTSAEDWNRLMTGQVGQVKETKLERLLLPPVRFGCPLATIFITNFIC